MYPSLVFTKIFSSLHIISILHDQATHGTGASRKENVSQTLLGINRTESSTDSDTVDNTYNHDLIRNAPYRMEYNISQGRSTLRDLTSIEKAYLQMEIQINNNSSSSSPILGALKILLHGDAGQGSAMDKAHELILGVNMTNIEQAEYAATHPGQTSWSADHPLTTEQDILHALIHRLEGNNLGEGGHLGYENAKYWLAGGDKKLESVCEHEVRRGMRDYVAQNSGRFQCLDLIANEEGASTACRTYNIIAGGGKLRNVHVREGEFDCFRFVDLCAKRYSSNNEVELKENSWNEEWTELIDELQEIELRLLLQLLAQE